MYPQWAHRRLEEMESTLLWHILVSLSIMVNKIVKNTAPTKEVALGRELREQ